MNRLKERYLHDIRPKLKEEFNMGNELSVPRLVKVVVSVGLGEAKDSPGVLEKVSQYLSLMVGQKPVVTKAKKSIASFKISKGQPIGMMVTLRDDKMYSFLDKVINVVLPKVRDFRGIGDESLDDKGNLNVGFREQTIFPEVDYKLVDKVRGLAVTLVTSATNRQQSKRLLELLGVPFRKEEIKS